MIDTDIPAKFPIPFGAAAPSGQIVNPIPAPSQVSILAGAASLADGFPPLCFLQDVFGGADPRGQDLNGILYQTTQWAIWQAAGGPNPFDADFAAAVDGYPNGAVLSSTSQQGSFWRNTLEGNFSNPDTGGGGWIGFSPINRYGVDTGAANAYACSYVPAITAHMPGVPITLKVSHTNTGISTFNPGPGAQRICRANGTPLIGGEMLAVDIVTLTYDGAQYRLPGVAPASSAVAIVGTDTQSAITPKSFMDTLNALLDPSAGYLRPANNLDDVASLATAARNLGFDSGAGWFKIPSGLIVQYGTSPLIPLTWTTFNGHQPAIGVIYGYFTQLQTFPIPFLAGPLAIFMSSTTTTGANFDPVRYAWRFPVGSDPAGRPILVGYALTEVYWSAFVISGEDPKASFYGTYSYPTGIPPGYPTPYPPAPVPTNTSTAAFTWVAIGR